MSCYRENYITLGSSNNIGYNVPVCRDGSEPRLVSSSEPKIFGPVIWPGLHIMAENYPEVADRDHHMGCVKFLEGLPYMLPCGSCGSHLLKKENSKSQLITEACNTRRGLRNFLVDAHNNVNENTGKKIWTPREARDHYCRIPACLDDRRDGWFDDTIPFPSGKVCMEDEFMS